MVVRPQFIGTLLLEFSKKMVCQLPHIIPLKMSHIALSCSHGHLLLSSAERNMVFTMEVFEGSGMQKEYKGTAFSADVLLMRNTT